MDVEGALLLLLFKKYLLHFLGEPFPRLWKRKKEIITSSVEETFLSSKVEEKDHLLSLIGGDLDHYHF